jgi:hypothetical protein
LSLGGTCEAIFVTTLDQCPFAYLENAKFTSTEQLDYRYHIDVLVAVAIHVLIIKLLLER